MRGMAGLALVALCNKLVPFTRYEKYYNQLNSSEFTQEQTPQSTMMFLDVNLVLILFLK
jgi:hypothetical protein